MNAPQPQVLTAREGAVTIVTINRPHARNALNAQVMTEFAAALDAAAADDSVRALVITGAGTAFCAGADITEIDGIGVDAALAPDGFPETLFSRLTRFHKPLVAAVNGLALGGGCELLLACDTAIAAESARIGLPEVTLGLIPGAGGTQRLIAAVGKAKAMRMLLSGKPIPSGEALAAGMVAEVTPDGQCLPAALALAGQIAANAPIAVQLARDAALTSLEVGLAAGLAHERRNFFLALHTQDRLEGVAAFIEKRNAAFVGH